MMWKFLIKILREGRLYSLADQIESPENDPEINIENCPRIYTLAHQFQVVPEKRNCVFSPLNEMTTLSL